MPHTTNRRAFRDADVSEPLFRLYTLLVATELALKDALGTYAMTHDLESLAKQHLGAGLSSALEAQLTALQTSLGALVCTHRGVQSPVDPTKYPGLRYLQLHADGFAGGSQTADVVQALNDAMVLIEELRLAGVIL
ncbi:hypothetical protein [Polyangium sp. 6x1]|uniref:hypothetical protein n=1 Tax=Polyangium sp. 6x1 TaxID=3042689 RepID=UPI00248225BC|nr:hypothetical protein [Polyangium sp. 6x1]MDI1447232.1 hypothetical protein [Polyangium sp. 6x1]